MVHDLQFFHKDILNRFHILEPVHIYFVSTFYLVAVGIHALAFRRQSVRL